MFFLALFVIGFLLTAFFSPKPKIENARASGLNDFTFPRATEGSPVPRVYGTVRFEAPNTIWAGDFKAEAITVKVKTGLFSSKRQTTGYKYYVGMDLAICLGPGFVFRRVWAGQHELWNGCLRETPFKCYNKINVNMPDVFGGSTGNGGFVGPISFYCGDYDQPQNAYLMGKIGPKVPAYVGVVHMVLEHVYFGNSANIEPINIEGSHFSNSLGLPEGKQYMQNGLDANPIEVLYDLYVNNWGNLAINPAKINVEQWRAIGLKIWDERNGISIVVGNSNTGSDLTSEILRQIAGVIYQNPQTGLFDIKLVRKDYVIADLPVLSPSNVISVASFTKNLWSETTNRTRVKFIDRAQAYKKDATAQANDFSNIRFQKRINAVEVSYPGVYVAELANQIAARDLANLNVPLYQCSLTVNRKAASFLPGSVFLFNWPEYGIFQMVMRIKKFGLGTLQDGTLSIDCIQDEFSSDVIVVAPPAGSDLPVIDYGPHQVVSYIYELPQFLDRATGQPSLPGYARTVVFAALPSPYSLSFDADLLASPDPVLMLDRSPYTATAKLFDAVNRLDGFVSTTLPFVRISALTNANILKIMQFPETERTSGRNLFMINGEIMMYEGFDGPTVEGLYTLQNVHRAFIDTGWTGGVLNDVVYFFDGQEGFFNDTTKIGTLEQIKLIDRTGQGPFDYDTATVKDFTPTGRNVKPYAPDYIKFNGVRQIGMFDVGSTVTVSWLERNRLTNPDVIKLETDASEAPEAGTSYTLQVWLDDNIIENHPGIAAPAFDLTLTDAMTGDAVVKVFSNVGILTSYSSSDAPINVLPIDGSITTDYSLIEIDGTRIIM
jgi:hypothetical protein